MTEIPTKPRVVVTRAQQQTLDSIVSVAGAIKAIVTSNEEYAAAGEHLVKIRANYTQIAAMHDEIASPLDRAFKDIKSSITKLRSFFDVPLARLKQSEAVLRDAMSVYLRVEEGKRATAQKLLDDAAAKERVRIQSLADAASMKAHREAQAARKAADKAEADGRAEAAAAALSKAQAIESAASIKADIAAVKIASLDAPVVQSNLPTAAGTTKRGTWQFEVNDNSKVPDEYWILDIGALRRAVAAGTREIPGVRIFEKIDVVLTGK